MAKTSGLGDNLYIDGNNVSGDIGSISNIAAPQKLLDFTGIDKLANERIGGTRDGALEFSAFFNPGPATDAAHVVLSTLPTTDRVVTYARGTNLGDSAACMIGKQINYDLSRDDSGALTAKVSAQANGYGLEWGQQLTAGRRTDTAATNGTALDNGAIVGATAFGAQAYLQVFALTGTDVTVKIQDSADNVTFADVAGLTFTQVTAGPSLRAQRLATGNTATIRRYVRAATVTTGGFTSASFSVVLVRNPVTGIVF